MCCGIRMMNKLDSLNALRVKRAKKAMKILNECKNYLLIRTIKIKTRIPFIKRLR